MDLDALFEQHPLPWTCKSSGIRDANGKAVHLSSVSLVDFTNTVNYIAEHVDELKAENAMLKGYRDEQERVGNILEKENAELKAKVSELDIKDHVGETSFRKVGGPNGCIWIAGASDETANLIVRLLNQSPEPEPPKEEWWVDEVNSRVGRHVALCRTTFIQSPDRDVIETVVRLLNANREEG